VYSKHHFVLSVLAGAALVPFVDTGLGPVGHVAYAAVLGVGIDVDHFLVARLNTGSWRALHGLAATPTRAFFAQDELFERGEVGVLDRLLSHVLIAGALVGGLLVVDALALAPDSLGIDATALAVVGGVVLYVHLLSDLVWDIHEAAADA
jgi:hypothetical protein